MGVDEYVVKVHGVSGFETAVILGIYARHIVHLVKAVAHEVFAVSSIQVGRLQFVLSHGYTRMDYAGFVYLLVQVEVLDDMFDDRFGVGGVIDRVIVRVTQQLCLLAQYAREDGVEGAHPQVASQLFSHELVDAVTHLTSGLVGESESEDMSCGNALLEQIGDFVCEYASLARASTCYD